MKIQEMIVESNFMYQMYLIFHLIKMLVNLDKQIFIDVLVICR